MANIGNHTFIDGVGDVRIRDGIVRVDLLALSPTRRDQEGNPVPQFVDQLVMSPAAFMRMVAALGQTVKQMQDTGMLAAGEGDAAREPAAESAAKADKPAAKKSSKSGKSTKSGSPNF